MANAATEVFRAVVPEVGLTLKVRAAIEGKQSAYEMRVCEDKDAKDDYRLVDYSANVPWLCSFPDSSEPTRIDAGEKVKFKPVFFETRYFFRGDFDANASRKVKDVQIDHRLASVGDAFNFDDGVLVGTLDFINEPGRFRLGLKIIYEDGGKRTVWLEFVVVSVKMNIMRDYATILTDIEHVRPRIAQTFLAKSFWGAALGGENHDDDKTWYQILSEVFEYYIRACRRIVNNPHQRYIRQDEYRRADRIKRWTPALTNRFNRLGPDQQRHFLFRTERVEGAIDTPENRFVLHTLKELARRLRRFAAEQETQKAVAGNWVEGVREMAEDLDKLSRHPFFAQVGRFAGFRQQSLVMQKQAGYAQILTVWLKLKRALEPGGDDVDVSYRPISMLYEFWCFLKMREKLEKTLGRPEKDEVLSATESELLETPELDDGTQIDDDKLCKLNVEFKKNGVKYVLTYQKTYSVRNLEGADEFAFTSINPQRPDIVLTIADAGNEYSYLFDAKYRIWSMPGRGQPPAEGQPPADADATTRDAIDAMYRYRDAILYRMHKAGIKRDIIGAYVLYPGRAKPHLYPLYKTTIEKEGIGAIPLLPGFEDELDDNLNRILERHSAVEHLAVATSVRGTSTVVGEAFGEGDALDIHLPGNAWDATVKGNTLSLNVEQLNGRKPEDIRLVRLVCPNKPELMAKVELHSKSIPPAEVAIVYNMTMSQPPPSGFRAG